MRKLLISALFLAAATPAAAAVDDDRRETDRVVRQLSDPRVARELGATLGAVVDALMDVRIGRLAAVLGGDRNPGRAESNRTLGDIASDGDPYFEERTRAEVGAVAAGTGAAMGALAASLPELMRTADRVEREVERATRNLPRDIGSSDRD